MDLDRHAGTVCVVAVIVVIKASASPSSIWS